MAGGWSVREQTAIRNDRGRLRQWLEWIREQSGALDEVAPGWLAEVITMALEGERAPEPGEDPTFWEKADERAAEEDRGEASEGAAGAGRGAGPDG